VTPAEELRAAAAKLRASDHHGSIEGDTTNPALIRLISNLLRAREPLATWLDWAAQMQADGEHVASRLRVKPDEGSYLGLDLAVAVARVINGGAQ
jgi:hypothetical protein